MWQWNNLPPSLTTTALIMTKILSLAELRKMMPEDLRREIMEQQSRVAALRLAVKLRKEKGVHLLKAARRELARMLTVLAETRRRKSVSSISPPV